MSELNDSDRISYKFEKVEASPPQKILNYLINLNDRLGSKIYAI